MSNVADPRDASGETVAQEPRTSTELQQIIRSQASVLVVGNRTKPSLSHVAGVTLVRLNNLSGIIEYEPSEFTFTAYAGTRVAEVIATLHEKGQYLPFDPMLVEAGATLGGSVAAGLSGPGRFRYGGIRDFILGVRAITGDARIINAGGKVVKNAAGFDVPKFLVGSLGRLCAMTEFTFKVFPNPPAWHTYRVPCRSEAQALERLVIAAASRWELDAIDYRPALSALFLRLGAYAEVNHAIAREITDTWDDVSRVDDSQASEFWKSISELDWSSGSSIIVKVPITLKDFPSLCDGIAGCRGANLHLSAAGAVAWVAIDDASSLEKLDQVLHHLGLCGLVVRGPSDSIWLGRRQQAEVMSAIKRAFDPNAKFPDL